MKLTKDPTPPWIKHAAVWSSFAQWMAVQYNRGKRGGWVTGECYGSWFLCQWTLVRITQVLWGAYAKVLPPWCALLCGSMANERIKLPVAPESLMLAQWEKWIRIDFIWLWSALGFTQWLFRAGMDWSWELQQSNWDLCHKTVCGMSADWLQQAVEESSEDRKGKKKTVRERGCLHAQLVDFLEVSAKLV